MSNSQILELRSKLFELGIKTMSYEESIYDNTLYLEHNRNSKTLFQIYYQAEEVWDNVGYCIGYGDGEVIVIPTLSETINFVSNLLK